MIAIVIGLFLVVGGSLGVYFVYQNTSREQIVTPSDAMISNKPVRGPLTMYAQADIIRKHTLTMTNGQTYAQMPRQIAKRDEAGKPVMDVEGKPVMVANTARDIWITATVLTNALYMGMLAYAFSGLTVLVGLLVVWAWIIFGACNKQSPSRS